MSAHRPWLEPVPRTMLAVASVVPLAVYAAVAALRAAHPYELEWLEGGSLQHVARVLEGQPLYSAPALEFVPFNYPPLYYYVSALVSLVIGPGFLPLRLVSIAGSLGCIVAIHALVRRETGSRTAALAAAGLFAATYRASGAWLDVARVDSLFLALFLAGLLAARGRAPSASAVAAGALLGLSFLAKQTALAMALPVVGWLLVTSPARGVLVAATLGAVVAASTAALHVASGGWYTFYVFQLPFLHPWVGSVAHTFWTHDLLGTVPVASAAGVAALALPRLRPAGSTGFWLASAAGMIGGAYRSRLQAGGYDNVLLPAYAAMAILAGIALGGGLRLAASWAPPKRLRAEALASAMFALQVALLAYDPRAAVPSDEDRRAGDEVVEVLRATAGEVFVPYHAYLALRAGKAPAAHGMAVFDVLKTAAPGSDRLRQEHERALRSRRYAVVILDEPEGYFFQREVEASYARDRALSAHPAAGFPVTGMRTRPQLVYRPRHDPAAR